MNNNNTIAVGASVGTFIFVASVAVFIIAFLIILNHRKTNRFSLKEKEPYWSTQSRSNDIDYASTVAPTDNENLGVELESKYNSEGRPV